MSRVLEAVENLAPERIIDRSLSESHGKPCLTCSFQVEDMIVLHLLRQYLPDIPVVFLETGYHFLETYAYRDRMTELLRHAAMAYHFRKLNESYGDT